MNFLDNASMYMVIRDSLEIYLSLIPMVKYGKMICDNAYFFILRLHLGAKPCERLVLCGLKFQYSYTWDWGRGGELRPFCL